MTTEPLHGCLDRFPGVALELSADGVVRSSNGRLDVLVGREVVGAPFAELLDSSSQSKWRRILSEPERLNPACTWELVLATPESLELRTFLAIWAGREPAPVLWLLEYAVDPKLERLYGELSELHRELVEAQRELGRERTRLAHALESSEAAVRSRDDVLAIVSHDLRNPLGTITMAAGLLELPISEERRSEQIGVIRRAAEGMNRLIADLLDVSAVESGRFHVELEPVPIESVLRDGCRMLEEHAAKKEQRLQCELAPELPVVRGDRHRILQVLTNLVGNAIKFTPEKGTILIRAEPEPDGVVVSVEDTGPGISDADLPHIFDRFWHIGRSRHGGAGLGLAIAKGIVEAHAGRIWVTSRPGHGSTFSFALLGQAESDSSDGPGQQEQGSETGAAGPDRIDR